MFLGPNFISAVCLLSLEIRIASATSYSNPLRYPVDSCGESSFTAASGYVSYSERYGSYRERGCSYRIYVGSNNSVALQFLTLSLQSTSGPCSRRWITLMCSLDETREAITKTSSEICHMSKWTSSSLRIDDCPVLFVILHKPTSDLTYSSPYRPVSMTTTTFQLKYEIQSSRTISPANVTDRPEMECGQTLFTNRSGVIVLPRRTDVSSTATINCTYTIESAARTPIRVSGVQKSISLDISHFDLLTLTDSLDACDQNRLQIFCTGVNGQRRAVWGCAQHFQPKYRDCVKLEMILRSDSYDPRTARQLSYYRKPGDTESEIDEDEDEDDEGEDRSNIGCGNTMFTGSSGNVTSPGFPLNHPHSIHCIYRIEVDPDKSLYLNFLRFSLETSRQCSFDWLKISCGLSEMNQTRKLCGDIEWTSAIRYSDCSSVTLMFFADGSITRGGFQIEYTTRPRQTSDSGDEVLACGTTEFRNNVGSLTLPSNPSGVMKTIDCTYNIYANETSFIFLDMTSINTTKIANSLAMCNIEQYMIACVDGADSWRFDLCEHRIWSSQPRFSDCRQVQMRLYSKYFDFQEAHEIPFKVIPSDAICGKTHFTASAGVISSPGFPNSYPPNVNCTYSIAGTISSTISVRFSIFNMSDSLSSFGSQDCKDWILMTCHSSNYVTPYADRRFCGQLTWPPVIHFFNCSTLLLKFSSGRAGHGSVPNQFSLNYTVSTSVTESTKVNLPVLGCGEVYSTSESGRVQLAHDPSIPLASLNCTFTVSMNGSRRGQISMHLRDYMLIPDESSSCSRDNITITCVSDQSNASLNSVKSHRYCWDAFSGTSLNYSGCDSIQFSMIYDVYRPQQQRTIAYSITSTDCGETEFSGRTGYVKSPRYPGLYQPNMHCVYTIEAGRNRTVSLQSLDLIIEGTGRSPYGYAACPHDWLIIRCNGGTEQVSEDDVPPPASPYDPDDDEYIPDFDDDYSLYYRYLVQHDRSHYFPSSSSSYLDRRLCGSDQVRTTLVNCETITLDFHTDSSVAYKGFNIQYNTTITDPTSAGRSGAPNYYNCDNKTFGGFSGTINSPNFTDRINCTYVIETGESNWVILEFLNFSSSAVVHPYRRYLGECQNTWLQVICVPGSTPHRNPLQGRRICTAPERNSILTGCQRVSIQFYSSIRAQFSIAYTISETGECRKTNFTNSTDTITSPGFPSLYPDNLDCTYRVEVGANNWLSLRIRSFILEGTGGYSHSPDAPSSCPYDYLQLTCASGEPEARSEILNLRLCGFKMPFKAKLTACRRAALRFVTDSSHEREGFQIDYKILKNGEDECGRKIFSNATGVIASPGFPSPYQDDTNCTYFIEIVGNRSSVLLQFLSFAVQILKGHFPFGCDSDWLQMRCVSGNVVAQNNVLNTRICGQKQPFNVTLTGCQRLALDFFADQTPAGRGSGFQIQYTIFNPDVVCGPTEFRDSSGILPFPNPSQNYITAFNCTYSIHVGNYNTTAFDIRSNAKATEEKESHPKDWILISCRRKELIESHKFTHDSGSQNYLKISKCSDVNVVFHKEKEATERCFSVSYTLLKDASPGSGTNRVVIGIIVAILILAALIGAAVYWWRRRRSEQKEDNRPFVPDDEESEQTDSGITTTEDGFSFSVHQPNKASCKKYISLDAMT